MPLEGEDGEPEAVAIALAQLASALRLEQQWQVRKLRHRISPTEVTVKQYMQRRTRDPFLAADHVRDLHQMVVHDVGHVVRGQSIGRFVKHLVVKDGRVDDHLTTDQVVDANILVRFDADTHHVARTTVDQPLHLVSWKRQGVAHLPARRGVVLEVGDLAPFGL